MLIEQSIAKQYGVLPSAQGELPYTDWVKLVSGLMHDTPLGQVVSIRSEDDPDTLRSFTPGQRAIRQEWREFTSGHVSSEDIQRQTAGLEAMFARLCGGEEN